MLIAVPMTRDASNEMIRGKHRHHGRVVGFKFAIGVRNEEILVGVATTGRPVSRELQTREPLTCEVTRVCTDGTRNACSFLYQRCARVAREMGYTRIITYILAGESGASLRAAGWSFVRMTEETRGYDRACRRRIDTHPKGIKQLWERRL